MARKCRCTAALAISLTWQDTPNVHEHEDLCQDTAHDGNVHMQTAAGGRCGDWRVHTVGVTYNKKDEAKANFKVAGGCVRWIAQEVGNQRCKGPVVPTVLEQVGQRHGWAAEPVHKERLEQPLGVMQHPASDTEPGNTYVHKVFPHSKCKV